MVMEILLEEVTTQLDIGGGLRVLLGSKSGWRSGVPDSGHCQCKSQTRKRHGVSRGLAGNRITRNVTFQVDGG